MNTLLADPPAAPATGAPPAAGPSAVPPEGPPDTTTPAQPPPQERACVHCGAPLQAGQQWCLQCGACAPGSLGERPTWRPLTVMALLAAILAAGAAVATAAALGKHKAAAPRPAVLALTATVPAATPSVTTPATPALPTTPGLRLGGSTSGKGSTKLLFPPASAARPPKIPSLAATPKSTGGSAGEASGSPGKSTATTPATTTTTTTAESKSNAGSGQSAQPNPILLDTDAATTYNPYNLPAADFGDPALAIDGELSTAWTAPVRASTFPNMAVGLLIDMRSPTKVGSVELATPTRGITVQLYGANGAKAPTTITEPGWTLLSGSHELKKKVTHRRLREGRGAFRFLLVWITKAPPAAQGTPQAPGHVALSEVALYPPAS